MSELAVGFRHMTPITVRFHDLDAFGHVNNARYLNFLEEGRCGVLSGRVWLGW